MNDLGATSGSVATLSAWEKVGQDSGEGQGTTGGDGWVTNEVSEPVVCLNSAHNWECLGRCVKSTGGEREDTKIKMDGILEVCETEEHKREDMARREVWTYAPSVFRSVPWQKRKKSKGDRLDNHGRCVKEDTSNDRAQQEQDAVEAIAEDEKKIIRVDDEEGDGKGGRMGGSDDDLLFRYSVVRHLEGIDRAAEGLTELANYIKLRGRVGGGGSSVHTDIGVREYEMIIKDEYWNDALINVWLDW